MSMKIIGIVLFFFVGIYHINAHENPIDNRINRTERFLKENGHVTYLQKLKLENKVIDEVHLAYLNNYSTDIREKIEGFFEGVKDLDSGSGFESQINSLFQKDRNWFDSTYLFFTNNYSADRNDHSEGINAVAASFSGCSCTNIGFEVGDFSGWDVYLGNACEGTLCNAFTLSSYALAGITRIEVNDGFTLPQYDALAGGTNLPVVAPGSTYSLRLGNIKNGGDAYKIKRTFCVSSTDPFLKYKYAVVLEDPGSDHNDDAKPYFMVRIYDQSNNPITCAEYKVMANPNSEEIKTNFKQSPTNPFVYYKPWTEVLVPLNAYIGQTLTVEYIVSDCAWGGHLGYAYIDGECGPLGNITSSSCPTPPLYDLKTLTAPIGFKYYLWEGVGIKGSNFNRSVKIREDGLFKVKMITETGCSFEQSVTTTACPIAAPVNCGLSISGVNISSCQTNDGSYSITGNFTVTNGTNEGVVCVTNGTQTKYYFGPFSSTRSFTLAPLFSDGAIGKKITAYYFTTSFISPGMHQCKDTQSYNAPSSCVSPVIPCNECIQSFSPLPNKKYIISGWVKDPSALPTDENLTDPYIFISFTGSSTTYTFSAQGMIIDGWQRIHQEFLIPSGATDISIQLKSNSGTVYFDDIRVHPADAGFQSYVYDPLTLRLVSVLDDNNYAAIYEYDQEGQLVRTKKETERGIITITENRQNSPKR